jgi:glycosyltransferase involved in cell wall biosynthesis
LLNAPTVVTVFDMIHELFPENFAKDDKTTHYKQLCVEHAAHVLCISESTARDLVRLFGVPREKISVTHLAYSSAFDAPPEETSNPKSGRPYILYVGHRVGYKNFVGALAAYASSPALRKEFDLVAFGGVPFDARELALIESLGLKGDRVRRVTGSDSDLALAYRRAHVFVYPSRYEGFGIPPLEAMSSGCAVACSNASSIPEVVGDSAALFDPDDVGSIAQALESVCFDSGRHQGLVAAGKRQAAHFSWDRCAQETVQAYERVLGTAHA